jgi:hypothetical protein
MIQYRSLRSKRFRHPSSIVVSSQLHSANKKYTKNRFELTKSNHKQEGKFCDIKQDNKSKSNGGMQAYIERRIEGQFCVSVFDDRCRRQLANVSVSVIERMLFCI